jgi:Haem-NO-binding
VKGVIFNIFEQFIVEKWGEEVFEDILAGAHLDSAEPFIGPATYPDEQIMALVVSASQKLQVPPEAATRAFGNFAFHVLAEKFPIFLKGIHDPKTFLLTVDKTIHVEVRKLYSGAVTPMFTYRDTEAQSLVIEYRSPRKLCPLMEGLISGLGEYYQSPIGCHHDRCLHKGDDCCEFHLSFSPRTHSKEEAVL